MKKIFAVIVVFSAVMLAKAGVVGLPAERIVLPAKSGSYLVRVWDDAKGDWSGDFEDLTGHRYFDFQFPEWGKDVLDRPMGRRYKGVCIRALGRPDENG